MIHKLVLAAIAGVVAAALTLSASLRGGHGRPLSDEASGQQA
jgi:hypothetical protein